MIGRLQKIMAHSGIASRRACEVLIEQGRVRVNGRVAKLGDIADSEKDLITVDGKRIALEKKVYIMLNKPSGFVTSVSDPKHRTVLELVRVKERVFPVGRLDKDAEGLVFLTNDGALANKLMHPRYETEKEYVVVLNRNFADVEKLKKGVRVRHRKAIPSTVKQLDSKKVLLVIHEGRKHVVKIMFKMLGYRVERLLRTRIGPLKLGNLRTGSWRFLNAKEIDSLKKLSESN